jgi:hypothetical protein
MVGVFEGVGDGTVADGVKVKVGRGVRDGTGVAVRRGVSLTNGESVLVATPLMAVGASGVVQLANPSRLSVNNSHRRESGFRVIERSSSIHVRHSSAQCSRESPNAQKGLPCVCPALFES